MTPPKPLTKTASVPGPELPAVLTADEVATLVRVDRKVIYSMVRRGKLPGSRRLGRCLRFSRDAILRWLAHGDPSHSNRE